MDSVKTQVMGSLEQMNFDAPLVERDEEHEIEADILNDEDFNELLESARDPFGEI